MSFLLFVACGTPQEAAETTRTWTMQAHDELAVKAREAVIAGDLVTAKAAGALLKEPTTVPGLDGRQAELYEEVVVLAARLEVAGSMGEAVRVVAELPVACGKCHAEADIEAPRRAAANDAATEMERHAWATAELWDALLFPDVARFETAAGTLIPAPLLPTGLDPALELSVHTAVERLVVADSNSQRAVAYGALLGACASCHQQAREPKP